LANGLNQKVNIYIAISTSELLSLKFEPLGYDEFYNFFPKPYILTNGAIYCKHNTSLWHVNEPYL
jgi:hypothetical protein